MKHQILTETKFFKLLDGMDNIDPTQLQVEYHIFIGRVIDLSRQAHEQHEAMHSLVFAETELQYHPLMRLGTEHIPLHVCEESLVVYPKDGAACQVGDIQYAFRPSSYECHRQGKVK